MSFLITVFKAFISLCNIPAEYPQEDQEQQRLLQPNVQHQQAPHEPIYPPQRPQQQQRLLQPYVQHQQAPHEPIDPPQRPQQQQRLLQPYVQHQQAPHEPIYPPQRPQQQQRLLQTYVQHQQAPHEPIDPPQRPQQQQQPSPHNGQAHSFTPPGQQHGDTDQITYASLLARANEERDLMAKSCEQGHEAHSRGDGALAKELSNQSKDHQKKMKALKKEASDCIFLKNNKHRKPGEIDLHGLSVHEAISRTKLALQQAKQRGDSQIHLIVGKGLHSQGGGAKIKPAIQNLMQKRNLVAELDPNNAGVLIVQINGSGVENRQVAEFDPSVT